MSEMSLDAAARRQRRTAIGLHPSQIGLDYVEAIAGGLLLHFVPSAFVPARGEGAKAAVPTLAIANLQILDSGGFPSPTLQVQAIDREEVALRVRVTLSQASSSPSSTFTLALVNVPHLDRFFDRATFTLDTSPISEFDSVSAPLLAPVPASDLDIDYLAKDYGSFRQLMLNRLSVLMPQWQERHPADLGTVLVEVLAYAGDRLSYYQDAVATEAYLGTARRRISVKRHAQLIDYRMHEGCNARVWVHLQSQGSGQGTLPAGTMLATQIPHHSEASLSWAEYETHRLQLQAFATLHPLDLFAAHNHLRFYAWGLDDYSLREGATSATLRGDLLDLHPGDVLILEEVLSPVTGQAATANRHHRHPVRLTTVELGVSDPLYNSGPLTRIAWASADALPFALAIARSQEGQRISDISVARGNIVLAEHGQRVLAEALPAVPDRQRYRPRLQQANLTHAVPYDAAQARRQPASLALGQDPRQAIPMINLQGGGETWWARRDLLSSDRFACDFVVETESDGLAYLRFGDGVRGRRPPQTARLLADYRVGNGAQGNVGQEAITHIVTPGPSSTEAQPSGLSPTITQVRNLLSAQGGTDPETLDQVRLYAPQVFHSEQQRCITAADYKRAAERHPEVHQAAATLRWTGSWYTAFIAVKRRQNRPLDAALQQTLLSFLDRYRLAGGDLEILAPRYVPLDIALTIKVAAGHFASTVKQTLLETFSHVDLPNGQRGFFHPDNFTFGQPVYFSQVVQAAMQIPGVAGVYLPGQADPSRLKFQRWGTAARGELEEGKIAIGALEIARLEHSVEAANSGRIAFHLQGGL
jgi:hypothetical protein